MAKLCRNLVLNPEEAWGPCLFQCAHLAGNAAGPPDLVEALQRRASLRASRERQDGRHSPEAVLRGVLGRTYPEEVLSRVLYDTQFTRSLDAHGYVRFKNWRFFGEDGLAGEQVSVWMYEGTLKIEYQATALSEYALHLSPDHQRIEAVKNPRRIETHFRSPQLHLWRTSDTEWLLALRRPDPAPRRSRSKIVATFRQLPLLDVSATG